VVSLPNRVGGRKATPFLWDGTATLTPGVIFGNHSDSLDRGRKSRPAKSMSLAPFSRCHCTRVACSPSHPRYAVFNFSSFANRGLSVMHWFGRVFGRSRKTPKPRRNDGIFPSHRIRCSHDRASALGSDWRLGGLQHTAGLANPQRLSSFRRRPFLGGRWQLWAVGRRS